MITSDLDVEQRRAMLTAFKSRRNELLLAMIDSSLITRVKILSTIPIIAAVAGTKQPKWAIYVINAT